MADKENEDITYGVQYVCWILEVAIKEESAPARLQHLIYTDLKMFTVSAWAATQAYLEDMVCRSH